MKKKIKRFFKLIFDIIIALLIATAVVAVFVVVYVAESPQEFYLLRKDNLVEYVLNREDDISYIDMTKNVYCAYVTTVEASTNFGYDPMLEDAYKHYTWNYESTKMIGEEKTKLISDNHEMALSIRDRVSDFYHNALKAYEDQGRWFPHLRALINTRSAIPLIRKQFVEDSKRDGAANIQNYYSSATIMDFWNNELGRLDYLASDGSVTRSEAFNKSILDKSLIETYSGLDPNYNNYTLLYVTNEIDYWVSWL